MPRGVKANKRTKKESEKKNTSADSFALSLEKQIEAAVDELPTMLYREMQTKKPDKKTIVLPSTEAMSAYAKKKRFMIGAVSIFSLAIFAIWVFNARQLFVTAINMPDTGTSPFSNSREKFSTMINRMSENDAVMSILNTVSEHTAAEEARTATFAADMAKRLENDPSPTAPSTTPTEKTPTP